jgi:cysteine desulfurase
MRINNKDIIYLDNNATTCTDTAVVEAMLPYFSEMYGNAMASTYIMGWQAEEAVSEATTQLAQLINAHPFEIIYTSGATESNNLAIKGFPFSGNERLLVSNIEHKCVLEAAKYMGDGNGLHLSILKCDSSGKIPVDTVHKALSENTMFVSIMLANNEIHSINPIKQIAKLCKEREILFHVDAAQAIGKIPVDVKEMDVDMLSLSAHKFYGPKGIGALYIKNGINHIKLKPLLHGGKQEKGLRSGTLAVPLIVGLGKAARIAKNKLTEKTAINKIKELTEKMYHGIKMEINDIILNGTALEERLPGGLNITFPNIDVGKLQFEIPHICFSRGSACSSGLLDYSYVLKAIGITPQQAVGTARFCIGRYNTETEIDEAVYEIVNAVKKLYTKKDYMYFLN